MATTEEIVAKYRLDLDELKGQVKTLQTEFGKVDQKAAETGKNVQGSFDKLGDTLKTLGKTVVAAFAVDRVIAFGKASLAAFEEAERSALKLNSAVSVNGGTAANLDRLLKQADQLEARSIFSAEQIQGLQTAALQFGLTADEVERLTPIVTDFASATGQDLNSAFGVIQAGVYGAEKGLRAYKITLDEGATAQENYIKITNSLTKQFQGQAAAINDTTTGQLKQLDDAWGDIQETVGAAIAPIVVGVSKAIRSVADFRDATKDEAQALREQQSAFETAALAIGPLAVGTEQRTQAIIALQQQYPGFLDNIDAETVGNDDLFKAVEKVNEQYIYQIALKQGQKDLAPILEDQANAALAAAESERLLTEELNKRIKQSQTSVNARNDENVALLRALPIQQAVNELLQGTTKLQGVSAASLGELSTRYDDYNAKQLELSSASIKAGDAQSAFNERIASLKKTFGIVETAAKTSTQSTLDYAKLADAKLKELVTKTGDSLAQAELDRRKKLREEQAKKDAEAAAKALEAAKKQAEDEAKQREDLQKQGLEQDTKNLELYNQQQLRLIEERYDAEQQLAKANAAEQQAQALADLQAGLITYEEYEKRKAAAAAAIPDKTAERERAKLAQELDTLQKQRQNLIDYGQDVAKIDEDIAAKRAALTRAGVAIDEQATADRLALAEEEAKAQEKLLEELQAKREAFNRATVESAQQLADSIIGLLNVQAENELQGLEESRAKQVEQYDAEQQDLDRQLERRLISQQVYEQRSAQLKDLRTKSEQDINKKMADIKRRQDAQAKAQALYRIGIDTAAAIQAQLKETPLPAGAFFVAAIAASGLLQAGTVLASKPPQYAEGVDWVPLGKNKRGRDTIPAMLDEGERVVSRRKNLDNWDLYEAIDHGKLDRFIFQRYTLPALQAERAKGGPVVQALGQLLGGGDRTASTADAAELRRLFRRGLPITNLEELAGLLTRHQPSPYRA